ncbi:MAG: transposase [bacterium]
MARRGRLQLEGYFYHIIARGQRKNPLFFSPDDMRIFISYLKKQLEDTDLEIFAYCIMRNHYHILLRLKSDPIYNLIHPLHTRYAILFNSKNNTTGHVFQDRPLSLIVLSRDYLYTILYYIHNNPVKARIVIRPEDYEFSSASVYKGKRPPKWLTVLTDYEEKLFDAGKLYNFTHEYIGTAQEYKTISKRADRINRLSGNRRNIKKQINKAIENVLNKHNITLHQFKTLKYRKNSKLKVSIISELYSKGLTQAEIARNLNYTKPAIHYILSKRDGG